MAAHVLRSSFNGGEISPLMDSRVDAEKHPFSCRKLENFIPRIYGGAFRRPGTIYVGTVGDSDNPVMLIDFNISATVRYIIELGEEYARIWNKDGTLFIDALNSPYTSVLELTTPYAAADLFDVKFVKLNNVCFFTHPDYPPQQLTRTYAANFTAFSFNWAEIDWSYPCFRDVNTSAVTATPAATTGTTTLSFSANVFNETTNYALYEGARIQVTHRREASFVNLALTTTANSDAIEVLGDFTVYTYGTWDGKLIVQRKDGAGNWQDIRTFKSDQDRNIEFDSTQVDSAEIRLSYTADTAGTGAPRATIEVSDSRRAGYAEITSIGFSMSLPVVDVTVIEEFDSTDATTEWAIEAWAPYSGYPRSVTFHEQRLWFGGSELEPNTFWGSVTNDFLNFRRGAYDADAMAFTLAAQEGSAIQSLLSHEALVIFTQTEEWTATTSEQTAITPSNIFVRRQSRTGSAARQAFIARNNILFLERGSRKLSEFVYSAQEAGGKSQDLTTLAEHITESGIKQIAYQQQPDPVLWFVTNDGLLLSLTYEANENVIAWARHPMTGTVESVAVIYGDADASDEVWIVANRNDSRLIEKIDPDNQTKIASADLSNLIYVDSAKVFTFDPPKATVTNLGHLEGQTVSILADGAVEADKVVTDGNITLSAPASTVVVGLPYDSILQPSKTEIPMEDGTSQGRKWICKEIIFNVWNTVGMEYADSPDSENWFDVSFRDSTTPLGTAQPLYTGTVEATNQGSHRENLDLTIRQRLPLPCNILAMIPKLDVMGD